MKKPEWLMLDVSWEAWAIGIALDVTYKRFGVSVGPFAVGIKWGLTPSEQLRRDLEVHHRRDLN